MVSADFYFGIWMKGLFKKSYHCTGWWWWWWELTQVPRNNIQYFVLKIDMAWNKLISKVFKGSSKNKRGECAKDKKYDVALAIITTGSKNH